LSQCLLIFFIRYCENKTDAGSCCEFLRRAATLGNKKLVGDGVKVCSVNGRDEFKPGFVMKGDILG
jgi:hypothetical protein